MELNKKHCEPCEGGVAALKATEIEALLHKISTKWTLNNNKIERTFNFVNFKHTMHFVNQVAEIAESEGHHPVIIVEYAKCTLQVWTHAINNLTENDFILAAKIDDL